MDDFQRLVLKTIVDSPEVKSLIERVGRLEAEIENGKHRAEPIPNLAVSRKDLIAQVGGALVRRGEAAGVLIPIVSNGGKGAKKRYPADQVTKLLNAYPLPKIIKNGKN